MKLNRFTLLLVLGLLALSLSACGTPPATTWSGLAADETAAYLTNGSIVYAVRLADGDQLWEFSSETKSTFYTNPVFTSDGQLLVGSSANDHALYRLDPKATDSGRATWSFTGAKDHWVAAPLVVGEMVYAPNADGSLYIFDLSIPGDDKLIETLELGGRLWAQPTTDGELVFVTSLDHHLYAVDMQSNSLAWELKLDGAIPGSALVADGKLYVGSLGSSLTAIDIASRKTAWTAPVENSVWSGPILAGEALYFGDLDGNFYALNVANGKRLLDPAQPGGAILASPIVAGGKLIFVSESGAVYSLDPGSNNPLSLETINAKLYTAPVLAGDLILVAPFQGEFLLVALDQNGIQKWSFTPGK